MQASTEASRIPQPRPQQRREEEQVHGVAQTPEALPVAASASDQAADLADGIASANADVAALEQVESVWPDVVRDVRVFDKTLQALLNSGVRPVDVKDNAVVLEVATDFLFKQLAKPALRQIVERVLSKHTGSNYAITCVVEAQNRENPNLLREQIRSSRKDPHVKAAINIFDADIIDVEHKQGGA